MLSDGSDRTSGDRSVAVRGARGSTPPTAVTSDADRDDIGKPSGCAHQVGVPHVQVLRQLTAGDEETWQAVMDHHGPRLRRVGRSYRLGSPEVEDALQNTWLSLLTHAGQVRNPEALGGWLTTSMRHECLRLLRRAGRRRECLVEDWAPYDAGVLDEPTGAALVDGAEDASQLWRLVGQLPPRQSRLIRMLFDPEEPSYADVSNRLAMPMGAIGPTRSRALQHLRTLVESSDAALST